jgi:hypothetical protein
LPSENLLKAIKNVNVPLPVAEKHTEGRVYEFEGGLSRENN